MPQNKIQDLRNHIFASLERLNDETLTPEELDKEIKRAGAIKDLAQVVVNSAKVEVDFHRAIGSTADSTTFLSLPSKSNA